MLGEYLQNGEIHTSHNAFKCFQVNLIKSGYQLGKEI